MKKFLQPKYYLWLLALPFLFLVNACNEDDEFEVPDTPYITSFMVTNPVNATGVIDNDTREIMVTVPNGTNLADVTVQAEVTNGADLTPGSGTSHDFSIGHVTFIASKGFKSTSYKVFLNEASVPMISSFGIVSPVTADGLVFQADNTLLARVPFGTDISALRVAVSGTDGATISPADGAEIDFSNGPVDFTITSAEGESQTYSASVEIVVPPVITAFGATEGSNTQLTSVIDEDAKTIDIVMPNGTDLSAIVVDITTPDGATVTPASGSTVDFSNGPVSFTVVGSLDSETYEVTVEEEPPLAIFGFNVTSPFTASGVIDNGAGTITVDVADCPEDLSAVLVSVDATSGSTVTPDTSQPIDFSNGPVTFTVDNSTDQATYEVSINNPKVIAFISDTDDIASITEADTKAAGEYLQNHYGCAFKVINVTTMTAADFSNVGAAYFYYDNTGSLAMPTNNTELTAAQTTMIADFVKAGGGLFTAGFGNLWTDEIGRFDVQPQIVGSGPGFANDDNWGVNNIAGIPTTGVNDHPIFANVSTTNVINPISGDTLGHEFVPFISTGWKEDHNSMWDLGAFGNLTEPHPSVARGAEFEAIYNATILGTWQHVTDMCCIAAMELHPEGDFQGRIIMMGAAAYEWENDGNDNPWISNVHTITTNGLDYIFND